MKFRDLEIGQTFRWGSPPAGDLETKTGPGTFTGEGGPDFVSKQRRNYTVTPEGEPPSAIEAAKRDRRWYVLNDMDLNVRADLVRAMRETEGIGMFEAQRKIRKQNLLYGLDVLRAEMIQGHDPAPVLHDLIEIVRELI